MKLTTLYLFGLTTLLPFLHAQQHEEGDQFVIKEETDIDINAIYNDAPILTLTSTNFEETIDHHHLVLVQYFAPWCGYCKALAPEFKEAADTLTQQGFNVAKVNCENEEELCVEHDVQSFPTLKVYENGIPLIYEGPRTASSIIRFMKRQTLPKVTLLKDEQDKTTFIKENQEEEKVIIIGYGPKEEEKKNQAKHDKMDEDEEEKEDQSVSGKFNKIAKELYNDYRFGFMENQHDNGFIIYQKIENELVKIYEGLLKEKKKEGDVDEEEDDSLSVHQLIKLIKQQLLPLVGEIGPDNFMDYDEAGLPLAYLFIDSKDTLKALLPDFTDLARKYKGVLSFVHIDALLYPDQANYLGLEADVPLEDQEDVEKEETQKDPKKTKSLWPAFVIQDHVKGKFAFQPQGSISSLAYKNVEQHIEDYLHDKLKPHVLSDPIPETNDGSVKIIVGNQYHDLITNAQQDVLLKIYAPWCGHCKALAPVWSRLGDVIQEQAYPLMMAKMDGTTNEIPLNDEVSIDIDGYPMIVFIEANTHRVAYYEGNRTLIDIADFIYQQQSMSSTIPHLQLSDEDIQSSYSSEQDEQEIEDHQDENGQDEDALQQEDIPDHVDTFNSDDILGEILKKEKEDQRIITEHDEL